MNSLPFEVDGVLPELWKSDLLSFAAHAKQHPWGGCELRRLVIAHDFAASLQKWMPAAEWSQLRSTYEAGRTTLTAGKHFLAKDNVSTAVIPSLPKKENFLHLFGHEFLEAVLDSRHRAENHVWTSQTHTGLAHIYWTEYAVERSRQEIATKMNLSPSDFEVAGIVDQINELDGELPDMIGWASMNGEIPAQLYQSVAELARVWSMMLGRGDGGSTAAKSEHRQFSDQPLAKKTATGWVALEAALRETFGKPCACAADHDQAVRSGWLPLITEFESFFGS
jgi:hypothetical protein